MPHTPGHWRWELNAKSKLVTLCGGRPPFDLSVMDFTRWGMSGATPRFRLPSSKLMLMRRALEFAEPVDGREHHASWFQTINHPDARLIAAAPDLLAALKGLVAACQSWDDAMRKIIPNLDVGPGTYLKKPMEAIRKAEEADRERA